MCPKTYYVYRLTCFHPDRVGGEQYYYGKRECYGDPQNDTMYFFSSWFVKAALSTYGALWFRKKILGIYETREEALGKEIDLHRLIKMHFDDAGENPSSVF
jgi:hypothetical protein